MESLLDVVRMDVYGAFTGLGFEFLVLFNLIHHYLALFILTKRFRAIIIFIQPLTALSKPNSDFLN